MNSLRHSLSRRLVVGTTMSTRPPMVSICSTAANTPTRVLPPPVGITIVPRLPLDFHFLRASCCSISLLLYIFSLFTIFTQCLVRFNHLIPTSWTQFSICRTIFTNFSWIICFSCTTSAIAFSHKKV